MKKLVAGLLLLGSVVMLGVSAKAATTANLLIKVTPSVTRSVTLSTGTLDFGSVAINATAVSAASVTVTNNGNVTETFGLRIITDDPVWTGAASGSGPAADSYRLAAIFNAGTTPVSGDFTVAGGEDQVSPGAVVQASATVYSNGVETGLNVPAVGGVDRGLWFRLDTPTTTSVATLRQFTVEVSAN